MTVLRTIRTAVGLERQLVQCDWCDTKTTGRPIRAGVGPVCVMMPSLDGLAS